MLFKKSNTSSKSMESFRLLCFKPNSNRSCINGIIEDFLTSSWGIFSNVGSFLLLLCHVIPRRDHMVARKISTVIVENRLLLFLSSGSTESSSLQQIYILLCNTFQNAFWIYVPIEAIRMGLLPSCKTCIRSEHHIL